MANKNARKGSAELGYRAHRARGRRPAPPTPLRRKTGAHVVRVGLTAAAGMRNLAEDAVRRCS